MHPDPNLTNEQIESFCNEASEVAQKMIDALSPFFESGRLSPNMIVFNSMISVGIVLEFLGNCVKECTQPGQMTLKKGDKVTQVNVEEIDTLFMIDVLRRMTINAFEIAKERARHEKIQPLKQS